MSPGRFRTHDPNLTSKEEEQQQQKKKKIKNKKSKAYSFIL
jgi:hypothetical protein